VLNWGKKKKVLVLCYHSISEERVKKLETRSLIMSRAQFASQIGLLSKMVDFISPKVFFENTELPARPVIITFDDATKGLIRNALPVLKKYGLQSLTFANIEHLKEGTPYWWDLADIAFDPNRDGSDFNKFLLDHRKLGAVAASDKLKKRLPAYTVCEDRLPMDKEEIGQWVAAGQFVGSHGNIHDPVSLWQGEKSTDPRELKQLVGDGFVPAIAFPYGEEPGCSETFELLCRQGFITAFGLKKRLADRAFSRQTLKADGRLMVVPQWSLLRLLLAILRAVWSS